MLKHLSIKNVAVIESAQIDFDKGFSVLTGETGAGKSIIIDAINMLKGERTSKGLIRSGESKARVDGEFEIDATTAAKIADILGAEPETDIYVSREMNQEGKNTIRINGIPVNLAILKAVGEYLVNIHGQHDNTSLLSVKNHIDFLDSFGGDNTLKLLDTYRTIHRQYIQYKDELEELQGDEQEKLRRKDMLLFQTQELGEANLIPGEDEELERQKLIMDNASHINENSVHAYELLYGGDEGTCHDLLWSAIKKLEDIADYSEEVAAIHSALTDAGYLIDEHARDLKSFCDNITFDYSEAQRIEDRLELIYNLKRKYGSTLEEVVAYYEKACTELERIETSDERVVELEMKLNSLAKERTQAAIKLREQRNKCAEILEKTVQSHLADLNMANVEIRVVIEECECGSDGADNVEFLIKTNVGDDMKPLAKIASGGELSRIMLAIKNALAGCDGEKTLIFDEIDTGVSGNAAQKIGEKLFSMSAASQVICITHLPQISALADTHYLIKKEVVGERTRTDVTPLNADGRIEEVARTLGGAEVTDIARANARQLLDDAVRIKRELLNQYERMK